MSTTDPRRALVWLIEAGADEAILDAGLDRTRPAPMPPSPPQSAPPPRPQPEPARTAPARPLEPAPAASVPSLAALTGLSELEAAVRAYDGCALKRTATNTVFADGNPSAPLMLIGEAPGADEDRLGRPFVGASGQLLDRMLKAIGLNRAESDASASAYITNILFWRPPGNRPPTPAEIEQCRPFLDRHIELKAPKLILVLGGSAAKTLLGRSEGIQRLRGRWFDYRTSLTNMQIPVLATYHPAYLLRTPGQKRDAWRDLLSLKAKLSELL